MTEQLKPCQHLNVTVTHAKGPHCVDCGALLVSVFSGVERAQPAQPLKTDPLFVFAQEVIHGAYRPEELKNAAMRAIRHHSAQPAQAVPLTDAEIDASSGTPDPTSDYGCGYYAGARWAEARLRGIAGKEGGNANQA